MEVNLSYVGNEEEDSRPIYKTYIMEGTKFCAMVLRELKKNTKQNQDTKMQSLRLWRDREKLTNV